MANTCWLNIRVKGKQNSIKDFFKILKCNYINSQLNDVAIYNMDNEYITNIDAIQFEGEDVFQLDCSCRWSLRYILSQGNPFDYVSYKKQLHQWQNARLISICKELNITLEAYSEEDGLDVYEYFNLCGNVEKFKDLERGYSVQWTL